MKKIFLAALACVIGGYVQAQDGKLEKIMEGIEWPTRLYSAVPPNTTIVDQFYSVQHLDMYGYDYDRQVYYIRKDFLDFLSGNIMAAHL